MNLLSGCKRLFILGTFILIFILANYGAAWSAGTFSPTGSMGTARLDHTATLLPNGKVLVAGGYNPSAILASAELYDPVTGTFSPTGSMGTATYGHTATLLPNGKVLVAGGFGLASAELYDPATGTFSPTGSMGTARYAPTATLLPNGKVLVTGGTGNAYFGTDVSREIAELYDPVTGTFSPTGSMGTTRFSHTATLLPNGKVLVAGGIYGSGGSASAELYDPATGTFSPTGSMGTIWFSPTATLLPNGKVLVAGGLGISAYLASAELYEPVICVSPPSGLVSWWPGNGNPDDIVGARNGSLVGSAGFAPGIVGDAFSFNGGGWVDVPDDPIWILGTEDFTIDLWVRFNSLSGRDPFIAHDNGSNEQDKWIFWYDAAGHDKQQGVPALRFHINSPHPAPVPFPHDTVVAPWNPLLGRWYHVAVTRSGNSYALYIDGAQVATDTSTFYIPDPVLPLTIGRAEAYTLNGLVDEVEIFDRSLSALEIQAIFNAGSAGKCKNLPPVANGGLDQTVHVGTLATLDGSGSYDPDENYPLSYAWVIASSPEGSTATLLNSNTINPTFTPDVVGDYTIHLVVTDSLGDSSVPDTVVISTTNTQPVADAGPDQTVEATSLSGASVTLNGSGSSDPDGDPLTYNWTGSFGGVSGVIPTVTLSLGTHTVTLTLSDGQATATDTVYITVQDTTAPETTITSAVDGNGAAVASGGATLSNSITFTFGGTDAVGVTGFQCGLDGAAYAPCTSPVGYLALAIGNHTFQVRALDTAGNIDPSPAGLTWVVVTPAQATQNLITAIGNMGLSAGVANSLSAPLSNINPNNKAAACGKLNAFINQVMAKTPPLTGAQATQLLQAANAIKASLGC